MIAVDTSALMAVALNEPEAEACIGALEAEPNVLISSGTAAEAMIVAAQRGVEEEMATLIHGLGFEIIPVTAGSAGRIATAYQRWGKGTDPAGLNIGDCFAYEVANEHDCRLLFVGSDFSRTDVESVI